MIKGFKKLFVTFALVTGLLVQTLPVQAATTNRNLLDRTGLQPMVEVPLDPNMISNDKYFSNAYVIKEADRAYWTKFSSNFYYNQLNATEKAFWDQLEEVCLTYATTSATYSNFDPPVVYCNANVIPLQRMKDLMFNFIYSNPQYYFLDSRIGFFEYGGGGCLYFYDAFVDGAARANATAQFTAKIDAWVAEIQSYGNPEQKFKAAHDIVCLNTYYDEEALDAELYGLPQPNPYHQSAYSMVCLGRTVCAGYTKALTILGNAVGIPTSFETSYGHAWNLVKLYGVWYEADATWADPDAGSYIYYDYYCKSRDTFYAVDASWGSDSHIVEACYDGMLAYTPYDLMDYYDDYVNPYFTVGGTTYFMVNCNPALGEPIVRYISGSTAMPETVSYMGTTFTVIGGADSTSSGTSSEAVAQINAFVERMYTVALGRTSDPSGISYWSNELLAKTHDGASLSRFFILGDEFSGKNYSNDKFIEVLYSTFFNRTADDGGKAYWAGKLANGETRASVLAGFVNSDEFFGLCTEYGISKGLLRADGTAINPGIYQFSERLYSMILERTGDRAGVEYWTSALDARSTTPEAAAMGFFFGGEYLAKQTNDEQYIMALYRTFMGREADADGLIYWKNAMGAGTNRQTVLSSFAQSNEFKQIMAQYGL